MNKQKRKNQQLFVTFMGLLLAVAMGLSLLLPLFTNQTLNTPQAQPTDIPVPTVPAPIEDLSIIQFNEPYLHPSGLFTSTIPTGYSPVNEFNNTGEAQVTLRNPNQLSVIEQRVLRPTEGIDLSSPDTFGDFFNDSWLGASWREYSTWEETDRRTEDDQLVIDFNLTRTRQQYIARQTVTTDGTWLYSTRVVTPSNAASNLRYLLENQAANLDIVDAFVGQPIQWRAYFDDANDFIIRYPGDWQVVDSAPGAPTSITGADAQLRVETVASDFADEDAVTAYVEGLRSGTDVQSVETVEVDGLSGYRVAYTYTTIDGASQSGLVQILPTDAFAYVQNLLLDNNSESDLNSVSEDNVAYNTVQLLNSFLQVPDLNLNAE